MNKFNMDIEIDINIGIDEQMPVLIVMIIISPASVKSACSAGNRSFINFKTCSLKKETEGESSNC